MYLHNVIDLLILYGQHLIRTNNTCTYNTVCVRPVPCLDRLHVQRTASLPGQNPELKVDFFSFLAEASGFLLGGKDRRNPGQSTHILFSTVWIPIPKIFCGSTRGILIPPVAMHSKLARGTSSLHLNLLNKLSLLNIPHRKCSVLPSSSPPSSEVRPSFFRFHSRQSNANIHWLTSLNQ